MLIQGGCRNENFVFLQGAFEGKMKAIIRTAIFLLVILFIFGMPARAESRVVATVFASPAGVPLAAGETLQVAIRIADVTDLWAFDLEVHFDPAMIEVTSVALGTFLDSGIKFSSINPTDGIISFVNAQINPSAPKSGDGELILININALENLEETHLTITKAELSDRDGSLIPCQIINSGDVNLTVAVSPEGSGTTTPAVGMHVYDAGAVVAVSAIPEDGYRFKNWSGDVANVEDPDSETTTITMNGNFSITANFVKEGTSEFLVYLPLVQH